MRNQFKIFNTYLSAGISGSGMDKMFNSKHELQDFLNSNHIINITVIKGDSNYQLVIVEYKPL